MHLYRLTWRSTLKVQSHQPYGKTSIKDVVVELPIGCSLRFWHQSHRPGLPNHRTFIAQSHQWKYAFKKRCVYNLKGPNSRKPTVENLILQNKYCASSESEHLPGLLATPAFATTRSMAPRAASAFLTTSSSCQRSYDG